MSRGPSTRWRLWLPLLIGAAALAFFGDKSPDDAVVPKTATMRAQPPPAPSVATQGANRGASDLRPLSPALPLNPPIDRSRLFPIAPSRHQTRDLFAAVTWLPVPLAPPPTQPPSAETGPALPALTVVGKKYEAQHWEVYLARGDQTMIAREGATIDDGLRVDRIAPPTMTLTLVATGQTMTLNIGEAR